MNSESDDAERDAAELCAKAREILGTMGSFRARVLLDMTLIELAREHADRLTALRSDSPDES